MVHYYSSSLAEKESHLLSIKPEAINFLNSRIDLISEEKAKIYPFYFRIKHFLEVFSESTEANRSDFKTDTLESNVLNSTYSGSAHLPLIDLMQVVESGSGKIETVRKSFVTLVLMGLSQFDDTPSDWNPTKCFASYYSAECFSLRKISGFKKYFSQLNGSFQNESGGGNHRFFGMLAYNLFANAHSMKKVEILDLRCFEMRETIFDGDTIDKLLDTVLPIEEGNYYKEYHFVFTSGKVHAHDLEEYLQFDIKKYRLANKLFGIPKIWIDSLKLSAWEKFVLRYDFFFDTKNIKRKFNLIEVLKKAKADFELELTNSSS